MLQSPRKITQANASSHYGFENRLEYFKLWVTGQLVIAGLHLPSKPLNSFNF
jgi:hypothetical protein